MGLSIQTMFEFEVDCVRSQGCLPRCIRRGHQCHLCSDPGHRGSSLLSSSLSSLDDRCEFHELVCAADEACQHYSDATREVGSLEHCLDAVRVALEASEMETTATQATVADA